MRVIIGSIGVELEWPPKQKEKDMGVPLREVEIDLNETIRIKGPNGETFRVRLITNGVRFVIERGDAQMMEYYGRGADSIAGFVW